MSKVTLRLSKSATQRNGEAIIDVIDGQEFSGVISIRGADDELIDLIICAVNASNRGLPSRRSQAGKER